MTTFLLNGISVETESTGKLLAYLREAGLTSVKDGCDQGACGACMVLIDGKAVRACTVRLPKLAGCSVLTLEGLEPAERELYARAFAACGAVQCGFCIPGMIISAKALLDKNPAPTHADVRQAIRGNICRCTGYKKIEQAILLVAAIRRGETTLEAAEAEHAEEAPLRVDALGKALGTAHYANDIQEPGMLFATALRSAYPRARILSLSTAAAAAYPGVVRILTADDVPGAHCIGHLKQDYPVMIGIGEITRFRGDALALVVAESEAIAREAAALIEVEYQPLPAVFSPEEAMAEGAPLVHESAGAETNLLSHERLQRGDAAAAIAAAAHQVTQSFDLPPTEHAFLEPECAVAWPDGGGVRIVSGDQGIYQTRKEVAAMLGLPQERVRVQAAEGVGGGFGGKEDMSVQHHAALAAYLVQRPVKVRLSRDESLLIHPKRHAMRVTVTVACDAEGYLTAMRARIISDTGAYASLGDPVLQRACTHASGAYRYRNLDIEGFAYYTNNPPAGAFRGFGVTQSVTAAEMCLTLLAEQVGISPWQIRWQNACRPGDRLPNGQLCGPDTALVETLAAVRPFCEEHPGYGIACAMKNSGLGVGVPDVGRCRIIVEQGQAVIHCSAACIGQGMGTVLLQMAGKVCGLPAECLRYATPDTQLAPDSGNTTASRQTLFAGEAARRAAHALREALQESGSLAALEGREFYGEYAGITDKMNSDSPDPRFHVAYSYATHVVLLDEAGRVEKVIAAHDVGRAVNPMSIEGQIEGGVTMSLGYALTEDFPLQEGRPLLKYGQLGLFRATETPDIVPILVKSDMPDEERDAQPAGGAKGVGEIASIPTPAAVLGAYYARDGILRTGLPMADTPYSRKK